MLKKAQIRFGEIWEEDVDIIKKIKERFGMGYGGHNIQKMLNVNNKKRELKEQIGHKVDLNRSMLIELVNSSEFPVVWEQGNFVFEISRWVGQDIEMKINRSDSWFVVMKIQFDDTKILIRYYKDLDVQDLKTIYKGVC